MDTDAGAVRVTVAVGMPGHPAMAAPTPADIDTARGAAGGARRGSACWVVDDIVVHPLVHLLHRGHGTAHGRAVGTVTPVDEPGMLGVARSARGTAGRPAGSALRAPPPG